MLPEFVNRRAGHVPVRMLLLSLVSFVIAPASDGAWGLVASCWRCEAGSTGRRE